MRGRLGLADGGGVVSIGSLDLLNVQLADLSMVHHGLGVVLPYSAVGLLLICDGRLPGLIDPSGREVLHAQAVIKMATHIRMHTCLMQPLALCVLAFVVAGGLCKSQTKASTSTSSVLQWTLQGESSLRVMRRLSLMQMRFATWAEM